MLKQPIITTDQARQLHKDRVEKYDDFINHVVGAMCDLYDHMQYTLHSSYVEEWPDPSYHNGFYKAIAIAGTRAFCDEEGITLDELYTHNACDIAEWVAYHPIQSSIVLEAESMLNFVWDKFADGDALDDVGSDYQIYCSECGGIDHLCYY